MSIKKGMVFLFVALFIAARILPVLPSLKALSGATHQLLSHHIPVLACADQHGADQDTGDDNDDKDNADKEVEKDLSKSVIDYHNWMLNNDMAAMYESNAVKALFHRYRPGKVRDHVNEVFRPPLV